MDIEWIRQYCLSLPHTTESVLWGDDSVFKVGGKIFAITALDAEPLTVSLKCDPELATRLRGRHPEITGGYHLNKRHWNTVTLDGSLPDQMIKDMVEDSYDLVVSGLPRSRRQALRWRAA